MALGQYLGAGSAVTVGLYRLDTNGNDSSGNSRNGTSTNITWVAGKTGAGAASFNGTTSVISGISNFGITGTFTATVWTKSPNIAQTSGAFFGIENQTPNNGSPTWGIATATGSTRLFVNKSYVIAMGSSSALTVSNNTWYKFGVTYNGSTLTYYHNGSQVGTASSTQTFNTVNAMAIGRDGLTTGWYNGVQDELVLEKGVAWTSGSFKKNYTYSVGRFGIL